MHVSVNLKALSDHLALLQDELREVNILLDLLDSRYRLAMEISAETAGELKRQMLFVHDERERIQRRKKFLEDAYDKFYEANRAVADQLEASVHTLRALEALHYYE